MINNTLLKALAAKWPTIKQLQKIPQPVTPSQTVSYLLLDSGFAYEYYSLENGTRIISWFWRAEEFIIPTSPYSTVVIAPGSRTVSYTYGEVIRDLREYQEDRQFYHMVRECHALQVADRIKDLKNLSPLKSYKKLRTTKSWVFKHATEELIASYIGVDVSDLKRLEQITDRYYSIYNNIGAQLRQLINRMNEEKNHPVIH